MLQLESRCSLRHAGAYGQVCAQFCNWRAAVDMQVHTDESVNVQGARKESLPAWHAMVEIGRAPYLQLQTESLLFGEPQFGAESKSLIATRACDRFC